jgi:hypothetical protein
MSGKYAIIVCAVLLSVLTAGCAASTDPLVGRWKQDAAGIIITMDLKEDGTGTLTMDMSAIVPGTPDKPATMTEALTWKKINDTCVQMRSAIDNSSYPGLFNYDKDNKHIWDASGSTRLDLYKQ